MVGCQYIFARPPDHRCSSMFAQVRTHTDAIHLNVSFSYDAAPLCYAHSAMLCSNPYFASVFESSCRERLIHNASNLELAIPKVLGLQSFTGLLEWIYTSHFGLECQNSDGRQLYIAAEMYQCDDLKSYLIAHAVNMSNVGSIMTFLNLPEGIDRHALRQRCEDLIHSHSLQSIQMVETLTLHTVQEIVKLRMVAPPDETLGWRRTRDCYRFINKWQESRVDHHELAFQLVHALLDLSLLPLKTLRQLMSEADPLIHPTQLQDIYVAKLKVDNHFEVEYSIEQRILVPGDAPELACLAIHQCGDSNRVAVVDRANLRVVVLRMDGTYLWSIESSQVSAPGLCRSPMAIAFNQLGELFLSDVARSKILVYDKFGDFIREFGIRGSQVGFIMDVMSMAFNSNWELVVSDSGNHRLQIFKQSGIHLRTLYHGYAQPNGYFASPRGVAVSSGDCMVCVSPVTCRVTMFDPLQGEGQTIGAVDQFDDCNGIATTSSTEGGKLILAVSDCTREEVQIFSSDGTIIQTLKGFSSPYGLMFDQAKRLWVADDASILILS